MSVTFTKLFSSITESTVWCEPDRTRLVWICMLAMADRHGRVFASIPGLANRARVPLADAETAINTFLGPDAYSRTPANEGRRIEPIDGGWRLLNHEKYRSIRDEETIKESKRNYINARRAKERADVENVEQSRSQSTHTEADTDPLIEPTALVGLPSNPAVVKPFRIPCPTEKLLETFHGQCPTLPRVMKLNDKRRTHLTARWREVDADSKFASADDGIEVFKTIFAKVHASDFLSGRAKSWHATFDWLTDSSTNFLKVCEGHYDNERRISK